MQLCTSSSRLVLLEGHLDSTCGHYSVARGRAARASLDIVMPAYRVAVIRPVTVDHSLSAEQLRRCVPPVPRERRVCRFCRVLLGG